MGDGDLSFSLSFKRAYPEISVTASSLVESPTELCKLYSNAANNSEELKESWKEQIIYKVDATHLKATIRDKYDMILFNHPHLGDSSLLKSESLAAQRHFSLLCHYFHSAVDILSEHGRIHVCLSGNQPKTWNVIEAATNCGLKCVSKESTSCPISKWLFQNGHNYQLADAKSHYKPPRKFRNGKLGSKHFLARYGYRHRRTEGDLFKGDTKEMNVQESLNFVFAIDEEACKKLHVEKGHTCNVCHMQFDDSENLRAHMRAPALPDVAQKSCREENPTTKNENVKCSSHAKEPNTKSIGSQDATLAATLASEEPQIKLINIKDATLVKAKVEKQYDSKRLKNLCRQEGFPLSSFIKTKSQVENAIKNGRVFVNGIVAFDSGRFLRENDIVTLVKEGHDQAADGNSNEAANTDASATIDFIQEIVSTRTQGLSIVIANKPVGIRCVGSFAPTTLQMKTQKHYEHSLGIELFCHPITKLDTGCSGLCALAISREEIGNLESLSICYTFTILVHGRLPETWKNGIYAKVPANGVRQWKRQKTATSCGAEDLDSSITLATTELDLENAILFKPLDELSISGVEEQSEQYISTLTASSRHDDGRLANVVPYILRKLGFPVVNDRFAKREYSSLPRKMKNILKQRICIGCYSLDIEFEGAKRSVSTDAHKRTQCQFWRDTLER